VVATGVAERPAAAPVFRVAAVVSVFSTFSTFAFFFVVVGIEEGLEEEDALGAEVDPLALLSAYARGTSTGGALAAVLEGDEDLESGAIVPSVSATGFGAAVAPFPEAAGAAACVWAAAGVVAA
jgi:hypothetical protein